MTFQKSKDSYSIGLPSGMKSDFKHLCEDIHGAGDLSSYRETLNSFKIVGTSTGQFKKMFN